MGLTSQSTWLGTLKENYMEKGTQNGFVVALAGNPNTGKSTVFNNLTGLNQHTGNWPGKTVAVARGGYKYKDAGYVVVDLPGIYSLLSNSPEEEIARDFLFFESPRACVVVADATCLERNLNLILQVMEITDKTIVCVNLLDEAERKGIKADLEKLSRLLGVPVVGTNAREGVGIDELRESIHEVINADKKSAGISIVYEGPIQAAVEELESCIKDVSDGNIKSRWIALRLIEGDKKVEERIFSDKKLHNKLKDIRKKLIEEYGSEDNIKESIMTSVVKKAEEIAGEVVTLKKSNYTEIDRKIDDIVVSKTFGIPIMIALLGAIFWITISGANIPSELLAKGLFYVENILRNFSLRYNIPAWIHEPLISGVYRTLAWVVSVMLPPMAIFFPLFTLLEDLGFLPRIAFNLDHLFKKAKAHGKQAITMCMGFGCNAAGVIACRIIDSPRERLIAILTNNFVPCNGRFPALIALSTIFIAGTFGVLKSIAASLTVLGLIVFSVFVTLIISKILSSTVLKGLPSSFILELPPYRKPQICRILIRSFLDRTLFVLTRAVIVAAPAGLIIWLLANTQIAGISLLSLGASLLEPIGKFFGMDGYILLAFILGFPANEIVIPVMLMGYMSTGALTEVQSLLDLKDLLVANGWTWVTALCTMIFFLNHFPCGTTVLTIYKETQSLKWTLMSVLIPTLTGLLLCFAVNFLAVNLFI